MKLIRSHSKARHARRGRAGFWAALAGSLASGLGMGAAGSLLGSQSKGPKIDHEKIAELYRILKGETAGAYGLASKQLLEAMGMLGQGFDKAAAEAGRTSQAARESVLSREKAQAGSIKGSAVGRGLYNTTALDTTGRGLAASTNRSLSEIDSALGGLMSELQARKAIAQAGVQQQIAGLTTQKLNTDIGLATDVLGKSYFTGQEQTTPWWQAGLGLGLAGAAPAFGNWASGLFGGGGKSGGGGGSSPGYFAPGH